MIHSWSFMGIRVKKSLGNRGTKQHRRNSITSRLLSHQVPALLSNIINKTNNYFNFVFYKR